VRPEHSGGARGGFTVTVIPGPQLDPSLGIEALYREHRGAVYRFLLRELRDPDDAEDATQTVFASAFRSITRGCTPRSPRPWLFAIARNAARRTWRDRAGRTAARIDPDTLPALDETNEHRQELLLALEALPDAQRRALVLHELGGLAYTEIAEETGQTVAGVETAIFRARRACRALLGTDGALDHRAAAKLLDRLVAGKLTRVERESVEAHVRVCHACTEEERALRAARPRRTRRLLGWLLSLPDGIQRLVGLLQAPSPRALAALVVASAAVAGGGGGGAGSAPEVATARRGQPPAVQPARFADPVVRGTRPGHVVARGVTPTRHASHRDRHAPHRDRTDTQAAPTRAVSRPVPQEPSVATPTPRVTPPVATPRTVSEAPTRVDVPRQPAAPPQSQPRLPVPVKAVSSVAEAGGGLLGSATELTDAVSSNVEEVTDDAAAAVSTLTVTTPEGSAPVSLPPPLAAPVAEAGGAVADTLAAVELPRLGAPDPP
jgi:RNA polymerase sigma-70 factor (ECF subfamily)